MWEVSKAGAKPSYVFGTMHVVDPRIVMLPPAVEAIFNRSDSFVMEAVIDDSQALEFSQMMFFTDGTRLDALLGDQLFEMTVSALANYGISREVAENMKPWGAYLTLNMPHAVGVPLDLMLLESARANGTAVYGLETLDEQARVMDDLAIEDQVNLLRDAVCNYDTVQKDVEEMKERYLARDLAGLWAFTDRYEVQDTKGYANLMKRLLSDRNRAMVERMQPMLRKGNAFIAIGALHLPGSHGVLSLLEEHGYTITAVY
ncbi:MAG: TraB/GumN family protein [Gammaproteobacteria bacterium]|nr:TraB/GumN family protein [Gammaproteobacteria bacterium]